MVNARKDQSRHDERARWITDRYFDGLLVHADPRFARLEDSFKPRHPLKTPLLYTGFVGPRRTTTAIKPPRLGVLVSAGGGMVGASLFQAAVQAHGDRVDEKRLKRDVHISQKSSNLIVRIKALVYHRIGICL